MRALVILDHPVIHNGVVVAHTACGIPTAHDQSLPEARPGEAATGNEPSAISAAHALSAYLGMRLRLRSPTSTRALTPSAQVRVSTMLTPQLLVQRLQQAFGDNGGRGYSLERARAMIEVGEGGVGGDPRPVALITHRVTRLWVTEYHTLAPAAAEPAEC